MEGFFISPIALNALLTANLKFPAKVPNRFKLISEFVSMRQQRTDGTATACKLTIGAFAKTNFDGTPSNCKLAIQIISKMHPEFMKDCELKEDCSISEERNAHKDIVLTSPVEKCIICDKNTTYPARCSFPLLFTDEGTKVCALFNSRCDICKITFSFSYYSCTEGNNRRRVYYNNVLDMPYLQISNQTLFCFNYLRRLDLEIWRGGMTFESCAGVYSELHFEKNRETLEKLLKFARSNDSLDLTDGRLEEGWFIYKLVNFFVEDGTLDCINFEIDQASNRRNMETICEDAWEIISKSQSQWLQHSCESAGCKEGYISVDGNEKLRRPMCAVSKEAVKLSQSMPKIMSCCPNSPIRGGRFCNPSKFCASHSNEEKENPATSTKKVVLTINLKEFTSQTTLLENSTQSLPSAEDDATRLGCKKKENIDKFYNTTAGILAMVRPCGVIVDFTEMYTCESLAQMFVFLLRVCGKNLERFRYIGYDRGCELEPYLAKLAEKGNEGANILLDNCEFLVDYFHCIRHTKSCCMPLEDNPNCKYHPRLPKFQEISGVNTQCAEQTFKWLNRFKYSVKKMTQYRFKFFMWCVIQSRNKQTVKK